jgi:protein TonB
LNRDGGFVLYLLASLLLHLFWLAVWPRPEQYPAPQAEIQVCFVSVGERRDVAAAGHAHLRAPYPDKAARQKASRSAAVLPDHSPRWPARHIRDAEAPAVAGHVAVARPLSDTSPSSAGIPPPAGDISGELSPLLSQAEGAGKPGADSGAPAGPAGEPVLGSPGAPAFLHRAVPVYPPFARRLGREGTVVLRLAIDAAGRLQRVEVLQEAGYGFTESALEALERSTFKPATSGGRFVGSRALLRVVFALNSR